MQSRPPPARCTPPRTGSKEWLYRGVLLECVAVFNDIGGDTKWLFGTSIYILALICCQRGGTITREKSTLASSSPRVSHVPVLTPEVGCSLVVDHAGGQRAVVRLGGAEQDVVGQRLVQHGAVRAGVGRALAVTAHALVRQRPVQGAPRGRAARRRHLREGEQFVKREARETTPTTAGERAAGGGGVGEQQSGIDCRLGSREDVDGLSRAGEGLAEWAGQKPGTGTGLVEVGTEVAAPWQQSR